MEGGFGVDSAKPVEFARPVVRGKAVVGCEALRAVFVGFAERGECFIAVTGGEVDTRRDAVGCDVDEEEMGISSFV